MPSASQPAVDLCADLERLMFTVLAPSASDGFDRLSELELTMAQARTLFVVARAGGPLPITEIAERVGLSLTAAGRSVERLVRLELVSRSESPDDRRVKLVALTEAGHAVIHEQLAAKRAGLARFVDLLDPKRREALHLALRAALDGLDGLDGPGNLDNLSPSSPQGASR